MSQETETVSNNPEASQNGAEAQKESSEDTQPSVQEDACILKRGVPDEAPPSVKKSPMAEATEEFILNEKNAYSEALAAAEVVDSEQSAPEPLAPEPATPVNSESSESAIEEQLESTAPQIVEVSFLSETVVVEEPLLAQLNGQVVEDETPVEEPEPQLMNGQSNGECKFQPKKAVNEDDEVETLNGTENEKNQLLNGTIASELVAEDYKLPDVVEVKKNFENIQPAGQNVTSAPPKKGALSTTLDSQSVKQAYQDVRHDGSETQWAVFKFEGPRIVTSAKGEDFNQFKKQFGDDERAFGYIRVQTGDEMSRRAKFLLVTWVGPSVSVLKRAKMSTDKALIKDVVSNFAVELQTENIGDIELRNFETELDKAAGAHYGTGVRS
ncbi:uncharacterized protein LOC109546902 [Dendroctonus ponderosae]|uniref:Coactosin-like protein n=1 Tax=Dendroctonus ponderosae TaxID=77166 RepID=A0AAR5QKF8_DENPD|nr:uncharacterized protein LOC109546902 [Dendroctonus ponderosae]